MKKISRRKFIKAGAAATTLVAAGCNLNPKKTEKNREISSTDGRSPSGAEQSCQLNESLTYEFIVVGSGAGGGPLAARLAQAGFHVLLIEAGPSDEQNASRFSEIPAAHGRAADDPAINWSFFVERYASQELRDKYEKTGKYQSAPGQGGIYYPRASALGGCTNVNALIHLYPDKEDWNEIAEITQDPSWNDERMWEHFKNLGDRNPVNQAKAQTDDRQIYREIANSEDFKKGWLHLHQAHKSLILKDPVLLAFTLAALKMEGLDDVINDVIQRGDLTFKLNPNARTYILNKAHQDGPFNIPMNATNGKRKGVREFLLETKRKYPNNLTIMGNSLCSKLLLRGSGKDTQVHGVEVFQGSYLYGASPLSKKQVNGSCRQFKATREVIIAGGAFNSPQLLMLSGIGRPEHLKEMDIQPLVVSPGVGLNLQDRYEMTVVNELKIPLKVANGCTFAKSNDPCLSTWRASLNKILAPEHLYSTNGVMLSMLKKSRPNRTTPDLNIFGLPGKFTGYYPKWSESAYDTGFFSWAVLKGHTENIAGFVNLKSNDFRDTPLINFRYFEDGTDKDGLDLESVVNGIELARRINRNVADNPLSARMIGKEIYPGPEKTGESLKEFVRQEAWGHHASCSNKMGHITDPLAVVDSEFQVKGVKNLRIVDASVFPKIPGLFLVLPILMISEKASQLIIEKYKKS